MEYYSGPRFSNSPESILLGAYDASKPLVVDPVLAYATYLGGNSVDDGHAIAVDTSGNAYVGGTTASTTFPTTVGSLQSGFGGGKSGAFVAKLNATGTALRYSTYLGGSGGDYGAGIAVDGAGNAYVVGDTASTNFPTVTPYQGSNRGGNYDAFVAKIGGAASGAVPWHAHHGVRMSDGLAASVDLADGHIDVNASDLSIPGRGPALTLNHTWDSTLAQGYITTTAG